jgi:hypothetical protein
MTLTPKLTTKPIDLKLDIFVILPMMYPIANITLPTRNNDARASIFYEPIDLC